jgi:hypothetical protein
LSADPPQKFSPRPTRRAHIVNIVNMEVPIVKKRKESFESTITEGKTGSKLDQKIRKLNISILIRYHFSLALEHRVKRRLSEENKIIHDELKADLNKVLEKSPRNEAISVVHTMKPVHNNNNNNAQHDVLSNPDKNAPQMDAEMKDEAEPIQALYPRLNNNDEDQFEYVATMHTHQIRDATDSHIAQTSHQRAAHVARLD